MSTASIRVVPSVVEELFTALFNLAQPEPNFRHLDWAQSIASSKPELVRRVQALWPRCIGIARTGTELFVMAASLGYLEDASPDRLLDHLPDLPARWLNHARSKPLFPQTQFPNFEVMVANRVWDLCSPARMSEYRSVLYDVWEAIRPIWESEGAVRVQAEVELFRQRLADGDSVMQILPPNHLIKLEQFSTVMKGFLQRGTLTVLPSFFAQGDHFFDLHGRLYVGYSIRSVSLAAARSAAATETALRMKALGDPTRLTLLSYITHIGVSVSELATLLNVSQPTVSEHLKVLRDAGLVNVHRRGTKAFYHGDKEAILELLMTVRGLVVRRNQ